MGPEKKRPDLERNGTSWNTPSYGLGRFVISRSSVRIRKAAPKREITDAMMASVFYRLCKETFFRKSIPGM
jgi:hypothetical protein